MNAVTCLNSDPHCRLNMLASFACTLPTHLAVVITSKGLCYKATFYSQFPLVHMAKYRDKLPRLLMFLMLYVLYSK